MRWVDSVLLEKLVRGNSVAVGMRGVGVKCRVIFREFSRNLLSMVFSVLCLTYGCIEC